MQTLSLIRNQIENQTEIVSRCIYDAKEQGIHGALIKLGWIPPRGVNKGGKIMEDQMGVDRFMEPVGEAIKRHVECPSDAFTDIYNRAWEAVQNALYSNGTIQKIKMKKEELYHQKFK